MYTHTPTKAFLCILSLLLCSTWSLAQTAAPKCYDVLSATANFLPEASAAYYNPYACTLDTTAIASATGTYTFTVGGAPTTCGEMMSAAGMFNYNI